MKVSFAKCEQIMETLPVGYYAGLRVDTILDEKSNSSYYSPHENKIVISYPMIAETFEKLPTIDKDELEKSIRGLLYHEVSHAILSPKNIKEGVSHITNVFEDERIETLLSDFYMNVDFKENLYRILGGPYEAVDGDTAFFNAVRFRLANNEILKEIEQIINDFRDMDSSSDSYSYGHYTLRIRDLYEKICGEFKKNPEQFQPPKNKENKKSEQNNTNKNSNSSNNKEQDSSEQNQEGNKDSKGTFGKISKKPGHGKGLTTPEIQKIMKNIFGNPFSLKPPEQKQLEAFRQQVENILSNFKKKNSGGTGISSYSGVFNPRSVVRDDYRFFDRALTTQGNNKYGTCHLNLFIDCSGSFYRSQNLVNGMMLVLSEIERKNRIFSYDVIYCGCGCKKVTNKKDRTMVCSGGNRLPKNMKEIFLSVQKQNTCNYNIILFDGDAFSDSNLTLKEQQSIFSAFDFKQTTLITNADNITYTKPGFNSAKVIVTENYTNELLKHITQALTVAFG